MSHVMVVEDEPITAADLELKLMQMGHEVSWFDTGEEAVARAPALAPDLVLMDIRLRGELNGVDAARTLREQCALPVVFLTAFSDQETVERVCATHPYGYLLKPFTERSVATAVQVALARVRAERAELAHERWITRALQYAGDAVIAVDEHALIRFINARAEALLGLRAEEVLGKDARTLLEFAESRGDATQPLEVALRDGRLTSSPARTLVCRPAGTRVLVSYSAAPVHREDGEKAGVVLVLRESKREQGAPVAEPLAAIDALSRRLQHEINNPLTYNLGALEVALHELDQLRARSALTEASSRTSTEQQEKKLLRITAFLRDAHHGASRIAGVVREMKRFALSERERAPFPPERLLDLAIGLSKVEDAEHVHLVREIGAAPIVHGNQWQLAGVLAYALRSSIESIERRGAHEISVTTAVTSDPRGWAELRVTTCAVGPLEPDAGATQPMPPAESTEVSRNLAEQVVDSHGGELTIVEQPAGRDITLCLPAMRVTGAQSRSAAPAEPERRRNVLVVDSEPMVRRALEIALRPEHDVVSVDSGECALDLLTRGDPFDVVLYDASLAGMSGPEFYARLRTARPQSVQHVVFMTGTHDGRDLAVEELEARRLEKPFTTDQLMARIAECA